MTSRSGDQEVEVRVSDWEFGCCVPPIVVGQFSRWWLTFCPTLEPESSYVWTVRGAAGGLRLDGHGITARW